jgi:hypothetical protein
MEELNNIWNADDELNEEQLMKYVQGKSTAEEAINENLNNRLANKKHKPRKGINNLSWELVTVIAVILLCILAYAIIELVRK